MSNAHTRAHRSVTDAERARILKLSDQGVDDDLIAERLGRCKATVQKVIREHKVMQEEPRYE